MKIRAIKILIFALLLGGFYAASGFERPRLSREDYRSDSRFTRAWLMTVALFVTGAVLSVWGNDIAELVDWDIPRGLYPALGVLLLLAGFLWMLMVRDSRTPNTALEPTRMGALGLPRVFGFGCVLRPRGSAFER